MEFPDAPGDGLRWKRKSKRSFPESFMKIGHQKLCQDSTCHPSLFLVSRRTWRFLMYLVHKLGLIEVLVIRLIFTLRAWEVPSLQPPPPNHNHHHHHNHYHHHHLSDDRDHPSKDWTSETLSRLHLSSKSVPGVLEDMEVPDVLCDGLRWK